MKINTIILIDNNLENKQIFIKKLKEKINFSYTKLEAIFQTIKEVSKIENCYLDSRKLYELLNQFLKKLSDKNEINLVDVDNLSVYNADKLIEQNPNIVVVYLQKNVNQDRLKSIDISNTEEINELINLLNKEE